jgi:hypothetical protein
LGGGPAGVPPSGAGEERERGSEEGLEPAACASMSPCSRGGCQSFGARTAIDRGASSAAAVRGELRLEKGEQGRGQGREMTVALRCASDGRSPLPLWGVGRAGAGCVLCSLGGALTIGKGKGR